MSMSDPVTLGQFFETMQQLRAELLSAHHRIRDEITDQRHSMTIGFARLEEKLDRHEKDDQAVERRVTIIETERNGEGKLATKRATIIGIIAATATTVGVSGFLKLIGWR